jgi:hypothetical protein
MKVNYDRPSSRQPAVSGKNHFYLPNHKISPLKLLSNVKFTRKINCQAFACQSAIFTIVWEYVFECRYRQKKSHHVWSNEQNETHARRNQVTSSPYHVDFRSSSLLNHYEDINQGFWELGHIFIGPITQDNNATNQNNEFWLSNPRLHCN